MPVVLTQLEATIVHVTLDMRVMDLKETVLVSVLLTNVHSYGICEYYIVLCVYLQILMNVPEICQSVIPRPTVQTQMVVTCVHVTLVSLDQDSFALV